MDDIRTADAVDVSPKMTNASIAENVADKLASTGVVAGNFFKVVFSVRKLDVFVVKDELGLYQLHRHTPCWRSMTYKLLP